MPERLDGAHSYYIASLRVRRQLIPVANQPSAVRCITHRANGPEDDDAVLADQVEFEDLLIGLRLMRPRDAAQAAMAITWSFLHIDKLWSSTRPPAGKPKETLLRYID